MLTITADTADASRWLLNVLGKLSDDGLRGMLSEIGEDLAESTKQRFVTSTAPDGSRWAANSQLTYLGLIARTDKALRKDGRVNSKMATKLANKRPLVDTGTLSDSITYQVSGSTLEVGTNTVYAATHQYGAKQGAYGRTRRGAPIPWGDIPARPFLGLSKDDERAIERTVLATLGGIGG